MNGIRYFVQGLFHNVEQTSAACDQREEMIADLTTKAEELIAENVPESEAVDRVIASLGNTQELLAGFIPAKPAGGGKKIRLAALDGDWYLIVLALPLFVLLAILSLALLRSIHIYLHWDYPGSTPPSYYDWVILPIIIWTIIAIIFGLAVLTIMHTYRNRQKLGVLPEFTAWYYGGKQQVFLPLACCFVIMLASCLWMVGEIAIALSLFPAACVAYFVLSQHFYRYMAGWHRYATD